MPYSDLLTQVKEWIGHAEQQKDLHVSMPVGAAKQLFYHLEAYERPPMLTAKDVHVAIAAAVHTFPGAQSWMPTLNHIIGELQFQCAAENLNLELLGRRKDWPQECHLCKRVIAESDDTLDHGLGECVEVCDACQGSGMRDPEKPDVVKELLAARTEVARLTALINTPEILDFIKAVQIEAVHQRERWGSAHDEGKEAADWFWLLGYLAGKALSSDKAGDRDKMLHHIITTAAACANWHAQILGKCDMRPGIPTPPGEGAPHEKPI